jgi:hypothetical protein
MDATSFNSHNKSQLSQLEEYLSSFSCREGEGGEVTADSRSEHVAKKVEIVMNVPANNSGGKFGNYTGSLGSNSYSFFVVDAAKSLLSCISAFFLSFTNLLTRWIIDDSRYLIRSLSKDKEYYDICCSDDATSRGLSQNQNYYYIIRLVVLTLICLFFIYKEIKWIFLIYFFKSSIR